MVDGRTLASRRNGALGGPKTEAGKRVSRLNARKHGILAVSLSPKDHRRLRPILGSFRDELAPCGAVEEALVEQIARTYLRLQRCAKAESAVHHAAWVPREHRGASMLERISDLRLSYFGELAGLFARYDRELTNQFLKLLHELERVQRMRQGEDVAPPAVAHVEVAHEDAATAAGPRRRRLP